VVIIILRTSGNISIVNMQSFHVRVGTLSKDVSYFLQTSRSQIGTVSLFIFSWEIKNNDVPLLNK